MEKFAYAKIHIAYNRSISVELHYEDGKEYLFHIRQADPDNNTILDIINGYVIKNNQELKARRIKILEDELKVLKGIK